MRISISTLALALLLGGCAGDAPDPIERQCSKQLYESCITEHDCMSNDCREFLAEGYQICTMGCTDTVPCPLLGEQAVPCVQGVCTPVEPVTCMVVP